MVWRRFQNQAARSARRMRATPAPTPPPMAASGTPLDESGGAGEAEVTGAELAGRGAGDWVVSGTMLVAGGVVVVLVGGGVVVVLAGG